MDTEAAAVDGFRRFQPPATGGPMSDVTVFSPRRESVAVAAMQRHNARITRTVAGYTQALVTAASLQRGPAAERVRLSLWDWCRSELLVHARAEERSLYPRALAEERGSLLVESMVEEHETIERLVDEVGAAENGVQAVAAASALLVMLESHLKKENEQLLPLLARSPYVSLADLVDGLDALVDAEAFPEQVRATG
jgi:hypothetical protein